MYYFNLPNAYFEDMLRVEADRMRNVAFTEKEFEPERTNVLSEYEMYNSQPEAALEWSMVASAFQAHGYKHDTIGFRNDIENYTLEKLKHFYDRHYWPDNATLVVVGDLGERRLLESVKKIFGRIKAGKKEKYVSTPEPKQEGVRRVTILRKTPVRVIHVAFKVPPALLRDWTTLNLLLCYLTDSKSSPLHKKLIDTGLASSLYGGIYPTKDPYLASIVVYAAENGSYAEIERIIFKTLAELSKVKLPKKAVHETQQYLYSRLLFSRDGTFKIAGALAEFVATGDWTRYLTVLNEIRSITSEEMRKVTAEYMQPSKAIIGTLENPS
jgi:zinc protease